MQITYELTQRDFLDAFIAHRNAHFFRRWAYRAIPIGALFLVFCGIVAIAENSTRTGVANALPPFGLALLWAYVFWGAPRLTARRQFRRQPAAQGERAMTVDENGVKWDVSTGRSEYQWPTFVRWNESETVISLYSSPACFNMIPKRALTPEQLAEFRQLLEQHIGPKNMQRKIAKN